MKQYGLLGYPLSHSFSKKYFTEKFEKEKINDCEYNLFPIEKIELLPQLIKEQTSLCGLNVTIPYKESIISFLNELDETAKTVGAVNCIKILSQTNVTPSMSHRAFCDGADISRCEGQKLIGFNTDVFGFRQSIKPFLESHHERALILGTGGAAKAFQFVLSQIGIDCYFVTRNKSKVKGQKVFDYHELNEYIIDSFKLIINCSPVGMFPNINEAPQLPYHFITSSHLLYDLNYNPAETEFLKRGKSHGASIVNGLSMLHQQAEEAWRIWNT